MVSVGLVAFDSFVEQLQFKTLETLPASYAESRVSMQFYMRTISEYFCCRFGCRVQCILCDYDFIAVHNLATFNRPDEMNVHSKYQPQPLAFFRTHVQY